MDFFFALIFISKDITLKYLGFDYGVFGSSLHAVPPCPPAGWVSALPASCPQNKGEKGWGSQPATVFAPWPEWRRRKGGGQRRRERRGTEAWSLLTASSCFHTHQTSCVGSGVWLSFFLFSSNV